MTMFRQDDIVLFGYILSISAKERVPFACFPSIKFQITK